ncbi:MAG: 2-C-methyl-D-erythritol 2,4-cyclodiphosphate synthase [Armatimonadetes bacterium]|nr:2-C-methyl-D-erythritol 2,4-cyclodiphosphate synthase [Armatimonadota bacterium]
MTHPFAAVLPAAGRGTRFGSEDKLLMNLCGKPLLWWTISVFGESPRISWVVVPVPPARLHKFKGLVASWEFEKYVQVIPGGAYRHLSVLEGLKVLPEETRWVAIHDADRPLLTPELLESVLDAAERVNAVIPAVPIKDTVKRVDLQERINETLPRGDLRAAQTPQVFELKFLRSALEALDPNEIPTDEASILEKIVATHAVAGSYENLKITTPEDLEYARWILAKRLDRRLEKGLRIGIGYDSHRIAEGRPLYLGGVQIPWDKGLVGHSDGDVLLHAVIDALLGASGGMDMGHHFPDTDPAYAGIRSTELFQRAWKDLKKEGYRLNNLDSVILAQEPKLAPHIQEIRQSLAALLEVSPNLIAVKAKTGEEMDSVGRGEGMAAHVAVTLVAGSY